MFLFPKRQPAQVPFSVSQRSPSKTVHLWETSQEAVTVSWNRTVMREVTLSEYTVFSSQKGGAIPSLLVCPLSPRMHRPTCLHGVHIPQTCSLVSTQCTYRCAHTQTLFPRGAQPSQLCSVTTGDGSEAIMQDVSLWRKGC